MALSLLSVCALLVACGSDESTGAADASGSDNGDGADKAAADKKAPDEFDGNQVAEQIAGDAVEFLLSRYHADEGPRWGPQVDQGSFHVGLNAMVLNGLLRGPRPVLPSENEQVEATLASLIERAHDNPHGIVWSGQGDGYAVYESATSLRAMVEAARQDPAWREATEVDETIRRVRRYLLSAQIDEIQELGFEDDFQISGPDDEMGEHYGGWGYGQVRRENRAPANMSTTNMAMEALYESFEVVEGTSEEQEQFEAAQRKLQNFLRHVHNLREYQGPEGRTVHWNDRIVEDVHDPRDADQMGQPDEPQLMAGTDGGAMYSPGSSKAGFEQVDGGFFTPRSYGSMTYALLRLYVMSGISSQDPRVQAAYNWVSDAENYTFEYNPGFEVDGSSEYQGLFYYYFTAADTLARLAPEGHLVDSRGEEHNWRQDLTRTLQRLQNEDGSWTNGHDRWIEQDPRLASAYALIALGFSAEPPARN